MIEGYWLQRVEGHSVSPGRPLVGWVRCRLSTPRLLRQSPGGLRPSASTMAADIARPASRCRCWSSAIDQESSRSDSTSMSSGSVESCERKRACTSAGRAETGPESAPETIGSAWNDQSQPKEPEPGGRHALGGKPIEIRRAFTGQQITKDVVVDDDGSHLCRGEIGVVELPDKTQVVLSTGGLERGAAGAPRAGVGRPRRPGRQRSLDRLDPGPSDDVRPPGRTSVRSSKPEILRGLPLSILFTW